MYKTGTYGVYRSSIPAPGAPGLMGRSNAKGEGPESFAPEFGLIGATGFREQEDLHWLARTGFYLGVFGASAGIVMASGAASFELTSQAATIGASVGISLTGASILAGARSQIAHTQASDVFSEAAGWGAIFGLGINVAGEVLSNRWVNRVLNEPVFTPGSSPPDDFLWQEIHNWIDGHRLPFYFMAP